MAHLFADTPGAHIAKRGEAIVISKDKSVIMEVPLFEVELVTLVGDIQITTQALRALTRKGVRIAMLGSKGGLDCTISSHHHKHGALRLQQYRKHLDDARRLEFGRIIVWSKLKNSLELLLKHHRSHPDTDIRHEADAIRLEMGKIWQVQSRDEILGCEGISARHYYQGFSAMIRRPEFRMTGRSRRPPMDPVNALLSLGYTLLYNEIHAAIEGIGLDPYIGFLHEIEYGRASLACDLMEEYRFLVDALVLSLINRQVLHADDFVPDEQSGGIYLAPEGRKKFYAAYDSKMKSEVHHDGMTMSHRRMFSHNVARFARVIRDEEYVYVPYQMR